MTSDDRRHDEGRSMTGVNLYVGGDAGTVQGEKMSLGGYRCFTGAIRIKTRLDLSQVTGLLDSGAFSDKPERRLTPALALERQLVWETKARSFCDNDEWRVQALVSYDRLIDETWIDGKRYKRRWTLKAADTAVQETVDAAKYLAAQRDSLKPRKLVLTGQGVDAAQYADCAQEVLKYSTPDDWFGFGGWCIIGRNKSMLGEFEKTISLVLPMVKRAGIQHVHLFGVMWTPALGRLLWLADQYNITVSSDSKAPVTSCTYKDKKRAGVRRDYWRDNVQWWIDTLANLHQHADYRAPAHHMIIRQTSFLDQLEVA